MKLSNKLLCAILPLVLLGGGWLIGVVYANIKDDIERLKKGKASKEVVEMMKDDLKEIREDVKETKDDVRDIRNYLLPRRR